MSWTMTDSEIESMWRTCKDRNAQVRILADLNIKTKAEVLDKLRELQCDLRGVRMAKTGGGAPKKPPMDELRAMDLYQDGLDDLAIAEALGETQNRVKDWRRRMKLKPNKTEAAPAESPEREKEPVCEKLAEKRSPMDASTLLEVLRCVCEGYDGSKVEIRVIGDGETVDNALVQVRYDAGGVADVELSLQTG